MRDVSYDESCGVCKRNAEELEFNGEILWEDDLWIVRHADPPYGVAGWLTLYSRRHVPGPAYFSDEEAASFGPTLRTLELALEQVTGALRIYTVAMGESFPHFHGHLVPRYAKTPGDVSTWGIFDLGRRAREGEITVDVADVERISNEFRERVGKQTS